MPSDALRPLVNLESLSLRHNRIRRLNRRAFNASRALQTLDLSYNRLRKISKRSFHGLQSVRKIDLRHNRLVSLDQQTFLSLQQNTAGQAAVYVAGNPWLCNCIFESVFYHATIVHSASRPRLSIGLFARVAIRVWRENKNMPKIRICESGTDMQTLIASIVTKFYTALKTAKRPPRSS